MNDLERMRRLVKARRMLERMKEFLANNFMFDHKPYAIILDAFLLIGNLVDDIETLEAENKRLEDELDSALKENAYGDYDM